MEKWGSKKQVWWPEQEAGSLHLQSKHGAESKLEVVPGFLVSKPAPS